jgi:hypothetical protein
MAMQWCSIHGPFVGLGCPSCMSNVAHGYTPLVPQGCICPPTSEQTCQNRVCPRRACDLAAQTQGGSQ